MIKQEFIDFIKSNIQITDLAENVYGLAKKKEKATKSYPVYTSLTGEKFIVNAEKNTFFSDTGKKGDVIEFVKQIEGVGFKEAVQKIADYYKLDIEQSITNVNNFEKSENENLKRNFEMKKETEQVEKERERKKERWLMLYNVCTNTPFEKDVRGISKELLNFLIQQGQIKHYVKKERGWDIIKIKLKGEKGETIGGQDIFYNSKWQKIIHGNAGISILGNREKAQVLIIVESFFDAVSALEMQLQTMRIKNANATARDAFDAITAVSTQGALNDLKKRAILNLLKENRNLKMIVFAFDADTAGGGMKRQLAEFLKENGINAENNYTFVEMNFEDGVKDLNELLQKNKSKLIEAQKRQREKEQEQKGKKEKIVGLEI